MSLFVKPPIAMAFKFSTFSRRNRWFSSMGIDIINQLVTVVSTICQYITSIGIDMIQQRDCVIDIVTLPFTDYKINRITVCIYNCMDFCAGSTTERISQARSSFNLEIFSLRLFVFSKSEKGSSIITFVTYFYSFLFCHVVLQLLEPV